MKDASDEEVIAAAAKLKPWCEEREAVFILDDRVHLVEQTQADGVHLGRNDMPVDEARRVLGEKYIIGGTANTFEDIKRLHRQGADYIGCGPFRFTTTKQNLSPILGLNGYRSIIDDMATADIDIPLVAIGGITSGDIPALMQTGIDGVALSGAVLNAEDPIEEMKKIIDYEQQY